MFHSLSRACIRSIVVLAALASAVTPLEGQTPERSTTRGDTQMTPPPAPMLITRGSDEKTAAHRPQQRLRNPRPPGAAGDAPPELLGQTAARPILDRP